MTIILWLGEFGILQFMYQYVYLIEIIQYLICTILFNFYTPRKKFTWLYLVISFCLAIGYAFLLGYLRSIWPNSNLFKVCATLSLYGSMLAICFFCYNEKRNSSVLMNWITALAVREIIDVLHTVIVFLMGSNPRTMLVSLSDNNYINALFFDVVHIALLVVLFFLVRKRIRIIQDNQITIKVITISSLMLLSLVVLKTFLIIYSEESLPLFVCADCAIGMIAVFLIIMRTEILNESSFKMEQQIMTQVLSNNQEQYESLKTNIDVINMKAHDIKHQLNKIQNKLTEEEVSSLKKAVEAYDKNIKTGNPVLDTVLYTEVLKCDSLGISITYLCDGNHLNLFPTSQLYYLFSNIIDNAIEATKNLNKEKRIISFNVKERNNQIVIDECNYFQGNLRIENGVIATTKEDSRNHGFGLKSIRMIVNENQGTMNIRTEDDMFYMVINIPLPN